MRMFMLGKLPMGLLAGLKIIQLDETGASVSVPFKYLNKNPFRSMYFAVLSMAAELSSGILSLSAVYDASVPVSMLVLNMRAQFTKKARTKIVFRCDGGKTIAGAIQKSLETGEGQTVNVVSTGWDNSGEKVAEFTFTWTFKPK